MTFHRALTLLLAGGIFMAACKKPTLDDTKLLPEDNLGLEFTDTLTLITSTVREDTLDVSPATLALLGSMHDPELGYTNAGFYMPFRLLNSNLTLDDSAVTLDSIVLTLWYYNTYGDWRTPQTVNVFEMTEDLIDSVKYNSDKIFSVNPTPVGTKTFRPNLEDTITIGGVRYPPSLRIQLTNAFGQKFIDASGTADYADNASFRQFFKGLYVSASKAGGGEALVAFDPYQNGVRITLYYHDAQDSASTYNFPADPALVVNNYRHDYTNSDAGNGGDSLVFIQGLAGLNAKVQVPYIKNLGNIVINKAELVVTVLPNTLDNDTLFAPPVRLTLLAAGSDGKYDGATPDQVFPTTIFGGVVESETDSATNEKLIKYKFSLSRYYQEVISLGRQDYGIFILPDKRYQIPDRLVAGGGSHSRYRMKLNLTYELID